MTKSKKLILTAIVILGGGFVFLVIVGSMIPQKPRFQQIQDQCAEEFGNEGNEQVNQCVITVGIRELDQQEADKLKRASR